MPRHAKKVTFISLALLVLGSVAFYGWLLWSTSNPLQFRVVEVTPGPGPDGGSVVRFEVRNASLLTVKFTGAVSAFSQPLQDPLASQPATTGVQAFPDAGTGPQLLRPKETLTGTMETSHASSCQFEYQWEAGMLKWVRAAEDGLKGLLPRRLGSHIPTTYAIQRGTTTPAPVPVPAPGPAASPPSPPQAQSY